MFWDVAKRQNILVDMEVSMFDKQWRLMALQGPKGDTNDWIYLYCIQYLL